MVSEAFLDPADTMPIPCLSRLNPSQRDPFGLDRQEAEKHSLALLSAAGRPLQVRALHPCLLY
eukprot:285166-Heterocapsa_arctica.AAC.1